MHQVAQRLERLEQASSGLQSRRLSFEGRIYISVCAVQFLSGMLT